MVLPIFQFQSPRACQKLLWIILLPKWYCPTPPWAKSTSQASSWQLFSLVTILSLLRLLSLNFEPRRPAAMAISWNIETCYLKKHCIHIKSFLNFRSQKGHRVLIQHKRSSVGASMYSTWWQHNSCETLFSFCFEMKVSSYVFEDPSASDWRSFLSSILVHKVDHPEALGRATQAGLEGASHPPLLLRAVAPRLLAFRDVSSLITERACSSVMTNNLSSYFLFRCMLREDSPASSLPTCFVSE